MIVYSDFSISTSQTPKSKACLGTYYSLQSILISFMQDLIGKRSEILLNDPCSKTYKIAASVYLWNLESVWYEKIHR